MKTTENLSLKLFDGTDNFDYKVTNENFETIDSKLAKKTGVEAGSYGGFDTSSGVYNIPSVTVDEQGKVTKMSNSVLHPVDETRDGYLTYTDYTNFKSSVIKCAYGTVYNFEISTALYDIAFISTPLGVYFPRILNAMIKIYTESNQTLKSWIPIPYELILENTTMGFKKHINLRIPEEYKEYNKNSDGNYEFNYMIEYLAE